MTKNKVAVIKWLLPINYVDTDTYELTLNKYIHIYCTSQITHTLHMHDVHDTHNIIYIISIFHYFSSFALIQAYNWLWKLNIL